MKGYKQNAETANASAKAAMKRLWMDRGIVAGARTQLMCMLLCLWDWDEEDLKNAASQKGGFKKEFIRELMDRNEALMGSYNDKQEFESSAWVKTIKEEIGIDIMKYLEAIK